MLSIQVAAHWKELITYFTTIHFGIERKHVRNISHPFKSGVMLVP